MTNKINKANHYQRLNQVITGVSQQYPNSIAIQQGWQTVTYQQLENTSLRIANFLHHFAGKSKYIALVLDKSPQMISSILGVMKSGNVFVPVTPSFPEKRIQMILKEAQCQWLITSSQFLDKLQDIIKSNSHYFRVLLLDEMPANGSTHPGGELEQAKIFHLESDNQNQSFHIGAKEPEDDLCYIYFTSGSTGTPKAVMGHHTSLAHFIDWEIREFGIDREHKVSQLTIPSFDPYLRDIFVPLAVGATCCIPENHTILLAPQQLKAWLQENHISLVHIIPSLFKLLQQELDSTNDLPHLKYILIAGELLRGNDIAKFLKLLGDRIQLVNLYGPTETTLAKLFYPITGQDANRAIIPVGKPIDGTEVLVLDEHMAPCLTGNIGEIYIATPYRSAGYFNDSALTNKLFMKNPLNNDVDDIVYKTGDLGRWMPDGNLELVGRIDRQVKIRGVRVETREIENTLLSYKEIKEVVVLAKKDENQDYYLVAYYVAFVKEFPSSPLRDYLKKNLPDYMIPNYFMQIDKVPLSANGKVAIDLLPEHTCTTNEDVVYEAPKTQLEKALVTIWSDVLGVQEIGVTNNFFDMGGHSLKVTLLASRIHKYLDINVPFKELFDRPTIKELAVYLQSVDENPYSAITRAPIQKYYILSPAQLRMYILQQSTPETTAYNTPMVVEIEGELNLKKFNWAFKRLIRRHDNFRTSFKIIDNNVMQQIHPFEDFEVTYEEISETEARTYADKRFIRPFDLAVSPLIRVVLLNTAPQRYIWMVDMHHIITDGISSNILLKEFMTLYRGGALPMLKLQYKDFAMWQASEEGKAALKSQENFWLELFADDVIPLALPTDYSRDSAVDLLEGDAVYFELDEGSTRKLKQMLSDKVVTLYMVLLAVYYVLLFKHSGQEDIVIGAPVTDRTHDDLKNIIGMFVNTLALRNFPKYDKSFSDFLREVKENILNAFNNKDYPFDQLVYRLTQDNKLDRNVLFDVTFTLKNMDNQKLEMSGLTFKPYPFEINTTKFEQVFLAVETFGKISFVLRYSRNLYKKKTMEDYGRHYLEIINAVLENDTLTLGDIRLISDEKNAVEITDFSQLEQAIDFNF